MWGNSKEWAVTRKRERDRHNDDNDSSKLPYRAASLTIGPLPDSFSKEKKTRTSYPSFASHLIMADSTTDTAPAAKAIQVKLVLLGESLIRGGGGDRCVLQGGGGAISCPRCVLGTKGAKDGGTAVEASRADVEGLVWPAQSWRRALNG